MALTVQEKIKALPGGFEEKHLEDVKDSELPDRKLRSVSGLPSSNSLSEAVCIYQLLL